MSTAADALHVRHVRRAVYGPPVTAALGAVLLALGLVGLVVHARSQRDTVAPVSTPPVTAAPPAPTDAGHPYALIGADGSVWPSGKAEIPARASVAGAAAAPAGGYWIATRGGRVVGVGVPALGQHLLRAGSPPVVGIAAAPDVGYWLATADGHVYAFAARSYGDLGTSSHATVVGIAASARGGYWLATNDGHVYAFGGAPERGQVWGHLRAPVVGIAASAKTDGYWLATADGRVYFFGAPFRGETARLGVTQRIVGIAPASTGGYWLAAADGRVYAFGTPAEPMDRALDRVVAIVPR